MFNHKLLAGFSVKFAYEWIFFYIHSSSIIHTSSYGKLVHAVKYTLFNICNNYTVLSFVVTLYHMSAFSFLEGKNNNVGIIIRQPLGNKEF